MLKVTKNYRNQYLIQTETSTITSNSESQDPCLNFCFNGDCKLTSLNIPHCHCQNNFTGKRCEVNVCYNYCLNNGVCRVPTTQGDLQRNVSFSKCQKIGMYFNFFKQANSNDVRKFKFHTSWVSVVHQYLSFQQSPIA